MIELTLNGEKLYAEPGTLLSQAIAPHAPLDSPCGGKGRCGKCRVHAEGSLSPVSEAEKQLLTAEELAQNVRLACCCTVHGNCTVRTLQQAETQILGLKAINAERKRPFFNGFGAAIDLGTTTLAAALLDETGSILAQAGTLNPQSRWGADVISRIDAARKGESRELAAAVRGGMNRLLKELADAAKISVEEISGLVITGNTAMLYLLTETDTDCLAHAPFQADRLFGKTLTGQQLGLLCPEARVYLPRCFSAFVGADTNTALVFAEVTEHRDNCLLADIGTNGEVAFWNGSRLLCCSTAAGPAFEGAGLSMGMQGRRGAVDHVKTENGTLKAHVLGDCEPTGICGSGVIDALAGLLETEMMDETGCLEEDPAVICGKVSLSQKDVRTMQLAKSAICAGIKTLLAEAGVQENQVEHFFIAGGFGSYLDVISAGKIGLIPSSLTEKAQVLGNAALHGAVLLLMDQEKIQLSESLEKLAATVELASNPKFVQLYTEGMLFEENPENG